MGRRELALIRDLSDQREDMDMRTYRFSLETVDGRKAGYVDWRGQDWMDALESVMSAFPTRIVTNVSTLAPVAS